MTPPDAEGLFYFPTFLDDDLRPVILAPHRPAGPGAPQAGGVAAPVTLTAGSIKRQAVRASLLTESCAQGLYIPSRLSSSPFCSRV